MNRNKYRFLRREHNKGFAVYAVGAVFYTLWAIFSLPLLAYLTVGDSRFARMGGDILHGYQFVVYGRIVLNSRGFDWYFLYMLGAFAFGTLAIWIMDKGNAKMWAAEDEAKREHEDEKKRKKRLDDLRR